MPFVIRERLRTAGQDMYLLYTPVTDDAAGSWTSDKNIAEQYNTIERANEVASMLKLCNAGTVEHMVEEEEVSDWVIKSNITNEYIVQARIYREPEIWSHKLSKALRFDTAGAAKAFAGDFLLGAVEPDSDGQTLDMKYIAVPKKKEKNGKKALFQNTDIAENDYHFVVACNTPLRYLKKFLWANRTVEWVADIREAKQFKFRTSAETSARRISTAAVATFVHVVDSTTHKIKYCEPGQSLEKEEMSEKRDFRVQMDHGVGHQINVTYKDTTEMEALNRMFAEAKDMSNKPFTAGSIKMYKEAAHGGDNAGKSM